MAPYPQHALSDDNVARMASSSSSTNLEEERGVAESLGRRIRCEEESTQTEDSDPSGVHFQREPSSSLALDSSWDSGQGCLSGGESSSSSSSSTSGGGSSVMARLSRRVVGRLFAPERQDRSTQTMKDPLTAETEKLAFDIVFFTVGRRTAQTSDEITLCLRRNVQQMLDNHALVFHGMVSRLHLNSNSDLNQGFQDLANVLFSNNEVTWNKIIALFAFAARLALFCNEHHFENKMFDVASNLSQCAIEHLTPFLRRHGGWATLCQAFPAESDYESKIWTSLVITGLGLTMFASFLAWQR